MNKSMTIFYEVRDGLYVNLTNKCPCSCRFCLRQNRDHMENSDSLWLEHEPTLEEALAALETVDVRKYTEVVFCGFGEPTEALDTLLGVAKAIKEKYDKPIRINTNGLGNLINGKDIVPLLKGLIDTVSISLNTPDAERYYELVRPKFGKESFAEMLRFAEEAAKVIPNVVLTTVSTTLTEAEEEECRKICERIGARYRIRQMET